MQAAWQSRPIVTREAAPEALAVTVDEAKKALRISHADDDDFITGLIQTALAHLDGWEGALRRALITQDWRIAVCEADGCGRLFAPLSPVQTIEAIEYYAPDADTLSSATLSQFRLIKSPDWAYLEPKPGFSWPSLDDRPDALQAVFRCGYGDAGVSVPASILHAIKLLTGHFYENREETTALRLAQLPIGVQALIYPHKLGFAA